MHFELNLVKIKSYLNDIKIGSDAGGGTSGLTKVHSTEQKSVAMNLNTNSQGATLKNFCKSKDKKFNKVNFRKHLHILCFLITTFSFISFHEVLMAETIVMKADRWCPFNCDPSLQNKTHNGFAIDVAKIVFERKGHNVVYETDTWSNSIKQVRTGKATALVATTKADAPDFIYPTKSIGSNKECFYVKINDKWDFNGVESLVKRKLGTVESYAYSGEVTAFMLDHPETIVKASGPDPLEEGLKNLDNGKIDTLVENPFVFNYFTEKRKIRDHYADAGCTTGDDLYIGFSPKNPRSKEFAKILSDGILELRKDGTIDKIRSMYSLKEWSP